MQLDAPQQPYEQSYYPALGWQDHNQVANQTMYGQPMPWQIQGVAQMVPLAMPMAMPQQPYPQIATRMPEPAQHQPPYQALDRPQHRQAYPETTISHVPKAGRHKNPEVKQRGAKKVRPVEQVDYIHICDEYPPIVQEALKKTAPRPCSSSSSSCSSEKSDSTQEVPRASIPRATPAFTSIPPFQFPQYPQMSTRAWNAPRSYPRQWMHDAMGGDGANVKARYAPFPPLSGRAERPYRRRRPAPAPSNTHPKR
ncbi:hypothetical protein A1F95_07611 [Pyrenophora tritici-repentis]|nr:hypothetical protein A1F95_07611 [Pyrenophora tritici-repentis]